MSQSHEASTQLTPKPPSLSNLDLAENPRHVGGVRLTRFIGIGAMGRVYRGWHETLGIEVAVKILIEGSTSEERFLKEANIAARLVHDNVVRIHHAGKEGNEPYLILELVDGVNLRDYMRKSGQLPWLRALDLCSQAARGLACAHRAGIVHRDLKPSNMMLSRNDIIKLMDFGLAKDIDSDLSRADSRSVVGTPDYIAPEQAMDARKVGPQADIYALGVCLFHMLTGEVPFKRSNYTNTLLAHIHDPVPDVRSQVADVPRPMAILLERMMSKNPADRPADGGALVDELQELLESFESSSRFPSSIFSAVGHPLTRRIVRTSATASAVLALPIICMFAYTGVGIGHGGLGPEAAPPAGIQGAKAADPWQTPERAVFLLPENIPETLCVALSDAMDKSGLRVIERRSVDKLLQEQDLVREQRVDVASAISVGHLIGGHIALIGAGQEKQIHLRAVVVETGQVVASKMASYDDAAALVPGMISKALAQLPASGYAHIEPASGATTISLGARHGVTIGDSFDIFGGTPSDPGAAKGIAHVQSVSEDRAVITLDDAHPSVITGLVSKKQKSP